MNKILRIIFSCVIIVTMFFSIKVESFAVADITSPQIDVSALMMDRKEAHAGDEIHFSAKASDDVGVSSMGLAYTSPITHKFNYISLEYNSLTDRFEGSITVTKDTEAGLWELWYVTASDAAGNSISVYDSVANPVYTYTADLTGMYFNICSNENCVKSAFDWSADHKTCVIELTYTDEHAHIEKHDCYVKSDIIKEATCSEMGINHYTATYGSYSDSVEVKDIPINANNHSSETVVKNSKAPTCEEQGYEGDLCCKDCGAILKKGALIDSIGHEYTSEVTKEPSITEDGIRTYSCIKCGKTYQESILKLQENSEPFWNEVSNIIENSKNGKNIDLKFASNTCIPKNILESLKKNNKTIVFTLNNGVKWTVSGENISNIIDDKINFGVDLNTNMIPEMLISSINNRQEVLQFSLNHNGNFGLDAVLTINLMPDNAGKEADLYYYNKGAGKLEFMQKSTIKKDGMTDFDFSHASDYVIVIKNQDNANKDVLNNPESTQTNNNLHKKNSIKTGDTNNSLRFIFILELGLFLEIRYLFKRKSENMKKNL